MKQRFFFTIVALSLAGLTDGVTGALADPTLDLRDASGNLVASAWSRSTI